MVADLFYVFVLVVQQVARSIVAVVIVRAVAVPEVADRHRGNDGVVVFDTLQLVAERLVGVVQPVDKVRSRIGGFLAPLAHRQDVAVEVVGEMAHRKVHIRVRPGRSARLAVLVERFGQPARTVVAVAVGMLRTPVAPTPDHSGYLAIVTRLHKAVVVAQRFTKGFGSALVLTRQRVLLVDALELTPEVVGV